MKASKSITRMYRVNPRVLSLVKRSGGEFIVWICRTAHRYNFLTIRGKWEASLNTKVRGWTNRPPTSLLSYPASANIYLTSLPLALRFLAWRFDLPPPILPLSFHFAFLFDTDLEPRCRIWGIPFDLVIPWSRSFFIVNRGFSRLNPGSVSQSQHWSFESDEAYLNYICAKPLAVFVFE